MYHTPPPKMVSTRSAFKKEEDTRKEEDGQLQPQHASSEPPNWLRRQEKTPNFHRTSHNAGTVTKKETNPPPPGSAKSSNGKKSATSSIAARKKQLELEAARQKARIEMDLIDKQLAADLADLEDENYSPHLEERTCTEKEVEKWLDDSQAELDKAQEAPKRGEKSGDLCPPATTSAGTSDGTIQLLAAALKDMTAATARMRSDNNANLLSRICTPRDLPTFSGEPMEWLQFRQAYDQSTQVCNFSNEENLWRLRKCLRGPAKDAVASLLITATAPERIISTLELRFGNADTIISKIMLEIKKIPPMSPEYHKDIVVFSVKVQNFVAAVQAVGREEYLQGMNLVSTLLSKLPAVLISKWSDYSFPLITENKKSRMEILSDFLNEEAVKISTTANIPTRSDYHRSRYNDSGASRSHAVLVQTDRDNNKCLFCRASKHELTECKKFKKALRKDRWRYVKRFGVCFKCLTSRHDRETCPAPPCDKDGCGQAHHRLLHYPVNADQTIQERADPAQDTETVTHINVSSNTVLLKVLPVNIHGADGRIFNTTALLDDGSTVTLVSEGLAARAGLRGRRETMRVSGAWNNTEIVCNTSVLNFDISGVDNKVYSIKARSVSELNLPLQDFSVVDCNKYVNLKMLKDKLCTSKLRPEILIGQDNYHLLLSLQTCLGKPNEPVATRTPLGWCVHGIVPVPRNARRSHSTFHTYRLDDVMEEGAEDCLRDLHDQVQRSFSLESMGISGKPRENINDDRARSKLEQSAELIDGRWYVGLPWKDENCVMLDSRQNAMRRLKSLEKKIGSNEGFAQRYTDRVNHLLLNDFAEEVETSDLGPTPRTWYLPHFGVDNPNKKKLRLVFDAASKSNGLCLNDYLLQGPDLLASLLGIMMRFRENKFAVTGDIKDMFLRVKIKKEDQDAFRFLWRKNPNDPVKTYKMTSLIFGANCSPFVAQFVKNKNAQRFESSKPDAVTAIHKQHYMDDYIDSLPDEDITIQTVRDISDIHLSGGFEIRNWTSNSEAVLNSVPKNTLCEATVRFKTDHQYQGERTLGLIWHPVKDTLGFDLSLKHVPEAIVTGKQKPTKRLLLKVIMSIFDVFGFLSPFTIQGKIMLQETWRSKIDWDDLIPDDIFFKWCKWLDLLKTIGKIRIPRWHQACPSSVTEKDDVVALSGTRTYDRYEIATAGTSATMVTCTTNLSDVNAAAGADPCATKQVCYDNLQLHLFCDASTKAMCAVAYWRWTNKCNDVFISFIASKSRVAPVKYTSVPRLELQAALLAARLADTIVQEHRLEIKDRFFWSDSTAVLHWIDNNERNYKTFVANRLGEIDELTRAQEWRYVPTKMNVADCATREDYDPAVFENEWLKGPAFLLKDESHWPSNILKPDLQDFDTECVTLVQSLPGELPVPEPERFSSWLRLIRATATVIKFINKCKKLTVPESDVMRQAEQLLLRRAQLDSFPVEVANIEKGLCKNSKLLTLSPVMDENGMLRVGGRIDAASGIPDEMKNPVILDGKHHISRLIVRHYHIQAAHGNQETVVNNLKQKYWIIRLRPTVKYMVSRCMLCRIRKAKPEVPRMGDLPPARVAHHQRPFTHCGVDLFGPMEVSVGRRREKRYGVIFTCMTVRAIHLEMVPSLTSDSFIMALRRMASRRGWPQNLYSDNGTNLRGADTELKRSVQELDEEKLKTEAIIYGTQWTFIPPASPHWGGAWERLIRSVKGSLKIILKERAPREELLSTLLAEVENIVNSRPLTHVSVEPGNEESLTPNHFLIGSSSNLPTIGVFEGSDLYLRKLWRKAQYLADMFWKRWVKEVLPALLPRQKWTQDQPPLQIGDLVLIVDPDAPRNVWQRGIIQTVLPGKDGRVRLVEIKTKTGTLKRSASRVARIPLAVEC